MLKLTKKQPIIKLKSIFKLLFLTLMLCSIWWQIYPKLFWIHNLYTIQRPPSNHRPDFNWAYVKL